jgi:transposase-like protein
MPPLASKEQLLTNLVRLRRAERLAAHDEDIAAVRGDLERTVGPTVRRAVAARALGVSQTALDRWIAQYDVPAVITPAGRREVPLRPLVDLIEAVEERRGKDGHRHPLASVVREHRSAAQQLDLARILPSRYLRGWRKHGHRGAELRGLAYHRAVAQRLDERMVRDASDLLQRWRSEDRLDGRHADRWEEVLSWQLPRIARFLGEDSQRARDLRQSSPFAGMLNEHERRRVMDRVARAGV